MLFFRKSRYSNPIDKSNNGDRNLRMKEIKQERRRLDEEYEQYKSQIKEEEKAAKSRLISSYIGRSFYSKNTDILCDPISHNSDVWIYIHKIVNDKANCVVLREKSITMELLDIFSTPYSRARMVASSETSKNKGYPKMKIEGCKEISREDFIKVYMNITNGFASTFL